MLWSAGGRGAGIRDQGSELRITFEPQRRRGAEFFGDWGLGIRGVNESWVHEGEILCRAENERVECCCPNLS